MADSRKCRHAASADEASLPGEMTSAMLSLLGRSAVMHTGLERAGREAFAEALTALPFSLEEATRLLRPVSATDGDCFAPHLVLRTPGLASSALLLAPIYPALRVLSVREAARSWVIADFLCLDAAARRLEDDLVQRYVEDPGAEGDWRGALTVAGCPACDTLWELVTNAYAALRRPHEVQQETHFRDSDGFPFPVCFGEQPSPLQGTYGPVWRRSQVACILFGVCDVEAAYFGVSIPACVAALRHHSDNSETVRAAVLALLTLQYVPVPADVAGVLVACLGQHSGDRRVVRTLCDALAKWSAAPEFAAAIEASDVFAHLMEFVTAKIDGGDDEDDDEDDAVD